MSLNTLEDEILHLLKDKTKNSKIRKKDIMEWSTSEKQVKENLKYDELLISLPSLGVYVAIKRTLNKNKDNE